MADVKSINGYNIKDETARNNINTINNKLKDILTNVDDLRYKYASNYHIVGYPENMGSFFDKLTIYESYDKKDYKYYLNESLLKNSGGTTRYVDKSNTQSPTAGTEENPWKNLTHAFMYSNDGDTIIIKKGIYNINDLPNDPGLAKNNVNIICEKGTLFVGGTTLSWSQNASYSNIYQASRSNVSYVVDIRKRDEEIFTRLTKKSSLNEVSSNVGSYYDDGTNVYVNIGESVDDSKVAVCITMNYIPLNMYASSKNMKFYIENATFIHSYGRPLIRGAGSTSYTCEFNAKNCKFLFGGGNGWGSIVIADANAVFINCQASYNTSADGFTSHTDYNKSCNIIEINSIGSYNGLDLTSGTLANSSNGSTAHDGTHIIRIGGTYFNNKGGNVADVDVDTISLNYNCQAWDSLSADDDYHKIDFGVQSVGAHMWLYSCFAQGNSKYNIYSHTGTATVNISNCIYDTTGGNGTINIID